MPADPAIYLIADRVYRLRWAPQRQYLRVNGGPVSELLAWIDHDRAVIYAWSGVARANRPTLIRLALAQARREAVADHSERLLEPGCRVRVVPATGAFRATVSGCFRATLIPWPWW